MSIYPIIQFPDERLKIKAQPVEKVDEKIKQIIKIMFNTLYQSKNCAALAASQLDIPWEDGIPRRITVIDFSPKKDQPLCLINPEISNQTGETNLREGCMSVAVAVAAVKRYEKIKVKALNIEGKEIEFEADGFLAKCIQHEVDHLDGIIFLDKLSKIRQTLLKAKILKRKRS